MKLAEFTGFVVGNPPPSLGGRYFLFVKIQTACGITGWGEIYAGSFAPHLVIALAEDVYGRYLDGQDPHHIERFMRRALGSGFSQRPDPTMMGIISGLEMACWDIIGKAAGQPCYQLLGGQVQDQLRTYTYLYPDDTEDAGQFYADPIRAGEQAAKAVADGFTAVKFDPAGQYTVYDGRMPDLEAISRSAAFCREVRSAVGDKADILFGTHGQFTAAGALRMAQAIAPYDPLWFEEPCPPDNVEVLGQIASRSPVPVSTGERLCGLVEFAAAMEAGAAILQPNLGRAGGLLEGRKIASMAAMRHQLIAPHLYCGPVVAAANIQLATAIPNFLILESIKKMDGFHAELLVEPLHWDSGYILPPKTPGLGVEINEEVALAHAYEGQNLHLEMGQNPYDHIRDRYFPGG